MNSEWVTWIFEGIVLLAALAILFSRSVFHAGLYLLVVVISIGVIYALYGSEFFFISQILVYGGGILVLILFATMITSKAAIAKTENVPTSIPLILLATGLVALITVWVMAYQPRGVPYVIGTASLGKNLLLDYSLPLEVAGVLLLVSLIGSVLVAIQKPTDQ